MANEVFLTPEGLKKLEKELDYLRAVKRSEVAEKIKTAREFGDLSENAEYDAAKEEQAQVEGKIFEIELKLKSAIIIDESNLVRNIVSPGNTVRILDVEFKEELEYKIVGVTEADPSKNMISNASPIGAALLGKRKGDTVLVETPGGVLEFKVLEIK